MRASLLAVLVFLAPAPAFAQVAATDAALAEKLFEDGRKLMAQQRYEEACAKLSESQRLDPGVGTLLNLGECFEKNGKIASAWATYREAEAVATRDGQKKRATFAAAHAKALAPGLSYLVIDASGQVQITCDGRDIGSSLSTPLPFDPGAHRIEARATGFRPWSTAVDLAPKATLRVHVPALEPEVVVPPPVVVVPPPPPPAPVSRTPRYVAIGVGAVGVVGLGLGTFFGLRAKSLNDDADCDPSTCTRAGARAVDDAQTQATFSTIAFAVGAVAVVGAVVLYVTAPRTGLRAFTNPFVF